MKVIKRKCTKYNTILLMLDMGNEYFWRCESVAASRIAMARYSRGTPFLALETINCTLDLHAKAPRYRFLLFKNNHLYFAIKKIR